MLDRKHLHEITRDLGHEELCQILSWVTAKLDTREGARVRVSMPTMFYPADRPDAVVYTGLIPGDLMVLPETLGARGVNPLRGALIRWTDPADCEIVGKFFGDHDGGALHFDRDWSGGGGPLSYSLRKPAETATSYLERGSVHLVVEIPRAAIGSPPHLIFDRTRAPLLALNP